MTDEQIFNEIMIVRDKYNTKTTLQEWNDMILGLFHILVNESLSKQAESMLRAALLETVWRKSMLENFLILGMTRHG